MIRTVKAGAWTLYFGEMGERNELERELATLVGRGFVPADTKIVPSGGTKLVNGQPENPALTVWMFKALTVVQG